MKWLACEQALGLGVWVIWEEGPEPKSLLAGYEVTTQMKGYAQNVSVLSYFDIFLQFICLLFTFSHVLNKDLYYSNSRLEKPCLLTRRQHTR